VCCVITDPIVFHVCNKSISNYDIFIDTLEIERFLLTVRYYRPNVVGRSLSNALQYKSLPEMPPILCEAGERSTKILAYCLMPDHYHLLIRPTSLASLSKYIADVENSYTRYLNLRRSRRGPLWQNRFRRIPVKSDAQLRHVTRYIHLNPVTSYLCNRPEDWQYSSYRDYVNNPDVLGIYLKEVTMSSAVRYRRYVEDRIDYQRKLRLMKKHLI
jgi:putative transposase